MESFRELFLTLWVSIWSKQRLFCCDLVLLILPRIFGFQLTTPFAPGVSQCRGRWLLSKKLQMFAFIVLKHSEPLSATRSFAGPKLTLQFSKGTSRAHWVSVYGVGFIFTCWPTILTLDKLVTFFLQRKAYWTLCVQAFTKIEANSGFIEMEYRSNNHIRSGCFTVLTCIAVFEQKIIPICQSWETWLKNSHIWCSVFSIKTKKIKLKA